VATTMVATREADASSEGPASQPTVNAHKVTRRIPKQSRGARSGDPGVWRSGLIVRWSARASLDFRGLPC
jgi:hypothetical protein